MRQPSGSRNDIDFLCQAIGRRVPPEVCKLIEASVARCAFHQSMLHDALSTVYVTSVMDEASRIHLMIRQLKKFENSIIAGRCFESAAKEATLTGAVKTTETGEVSAKIYRKEVSPTTRAELREMR